MAAQIPTATAVSVPVATATTADAAPAAPPTSDAAASRGAEIVDMTTPLPSAAATSGSGGAAAEEAMPSSAPTMTRGESYQPNGPDVTVIPGVVNEHGVGDVLIRISPPDSTDGSRAPSDIVCVVDVSGSMAKSATVQAEKGQPQEDDGLTVLDITKHAVRTIIHALKPGDNFSLVSYSNSATTNLPLTSMDEAGKARASEILDTLSAGGGTNLWDGLHKGLEEIRTTSNPSRGSAVLLLTDGCPNVVPPRGHQAMLDRYKDSNPDMNCSISTFGFGYSLDSELLADLAIRGNGQFSFIPDAGFVGTTFVHAASNLLSTVARRVVLKVSSERDASYGRTAQTESACLLSGLGSSVTYPTWGVQVDLGTLTAGQTKDVVIRTSAPDDLCVDVDLVLNGRTEVMSISADAGSGAADAGAVQREVNRLEFVDMLQTTNNYMAINSDSLAQETVVAFGDKLKAQMGGQLAAGGFSIAGTSGVALAANTDAVTVELLKDVAGQVTEATSRRDWFNKWGKHYLPSLAQAHRLQQCNNFKDPGIQHYGGVLFNTLRDEADAIFMKLPPPKPTGGGRSFPANLPTPQRRTSSVKSISNATAAPAAPAINMSYYNNRNAGCFHGSSKVALVNGASKRCDRIVKGDRVRTSSTNPKASARVVCVVETAIAGGRTQMTKLPGGLLATPWHPVRIDGTSSWTFPIDVPGAETKDMVACGSVFSFVLEDPEANPGMVIEGYECITLGNAETGKVAGHSYFSSADVVGDLQQMAGWRKGHVRFQPNPLERDSTTDLLVRYRAAAEVR